jgi:hypothetical protein
LEARAGLVLYGKGRGEVSQTMNTHVNKCKNDIIKKVLIIIYANCFLFIIKEVIKDVI